ncbi:hypothetical protein BBJ28_00011126 [Nothophytophthora sp. Chile5]|nr:hypothetical protein BBJ28_00011126 [Nothophytophthora sp. Chile5]
MVLVTTETFLAKVAEFYEGAQAAKGSVAVSCKSGASPLRVWLRYAAPLVPVGLRSAFGGLKLAKSDAVTFMSPVPVAKVSGKAQQRIRKLTVEDGENVLLFRACKYGNNKHKKKYSTVVGPVTAVNHASFHAALGQIVKTKVDVAAKDVGSKRVVAKVKKTTE